MRRRARLGRALALALVSAAVLACSTPSAAPPPTSQAAVPAPVEITPQPVDVPAAPSAAAAVDPASVTAPVPVGPSPLANARAACDRGWERFGAGALDEASHELDLGLRALRDLALEDAEARRVLGACEYNEGRVLEAQGRAHEAAHAYERSLLYRENATVLARWRTLAPAEASPPTTAPSSLFTAVLAERRRLCGSRAPERVLRGGLMRPTCGVDILDVVMDGTDRGAAALARFSGYDPEVGESSLRWAFPLLVLASGRWRDARPLFHADGDVVDRYEVSLDLRELTGAPPGEVVANVSYAVSYVPSSDDGGASYEGMIVCGRFDQPSVACAELPIRSDDSEQDDDGPDWSEVELEAGGRVIIVDHTDGDDGDEVVRRETTLDALWR